MELRQLRYFVAVAEELNFRRAAERLHIAQPALSQQITKFEKELHAPLFERTTRRVELTEAGRTLLEEGRRVLTDADNARAAVDRVVHGEAGLLRIGFVSSAALRIIPATVLALRQAHPGVQVNLTESTTDPQLRAIADGALDVGLVREVDRAPGLVVRPLLRERLLLAVHESHRFADRSSVHLAELSEEAFLTFPRNEVSRLFDHIAALCHHAGFRLEATQEAVQFTTLLGLAAANTGVTIVPASLRALALAELRYVELADPEAVSTVSAVYRGDRRPSSTVSDFLDIAASFDAAVV